MAYLADKEPTGLTAKTTPIDADVVIIGDSADASEVAKQTTWANIKATLKTYFDTLYTPVGGGGIARSISSIATPTTAGATASTDYVYNVTNTTLTLPTAVGNQNQYTIKCISGTCVVDGDGAETIDGTANITIQVEDSVDLISNNTEWKVV